MNKQEVIDEALKLGSKDRTDIIGTLTAKAASEGIDNAVVKHHKPWMDTAWGKALIGVGSAAVAFVGSYFYNKVNDAPALPEPAVQQAPAELPAAE